MTAANTVSRASAEVSLSRRDHQRDDQRHLDHGDRDREHQGAERLADPERDHLGVVHRGQHRADQEHRHHRRRRTASTAPPGCRPHVPASTSTATTGTTTVQRNRPVVVALMTETLGTGFGSQSSRQSGPVDSSGAAAESARRGRPSYARKSFPHPVLRGVSVVSVASVFPRLEPKLPSVQKPIQYVGGELNSTVKDWDCAEDGPTVRWALMYPDAYEVGLPNQGVQILYEVLNERDWILAERTYSVWPDMERVMREGDIPQFTVDSHRPGARLRRARPELLDRARLHQHAQRARPRRHPAARCRPRRRRPDRARRRPRGVQPGADRRLPRRRRARRRRGGRARDLRGGPRVEGRGPARRPRRAAAPARGRAATSTSRGSTTSRTPPTARSRRSCRTGRASRSGSASTR